LLAALRLPKQRRFEVEESLDELGCLAESARAEIIPPWTKPMVLAMFSVGVISTTAAPSSRATSLIPSQRHAGETT